MSLVKIFVSYSRKDAGDFAEQLNKYFTSFRYDIFTDIDSISAGDVWNTTIETNISNCDIFVVIVTYGALDSPHVGNEVLQAQREKKRIIPCLHRTLRHSEIKWGLNKIQAVEFDDKFELARNLYPKILQKKDVAKINGDNGDSETCFKKGSVLHLLGKYNEAIQSYDRAIQIDPNDANAWQRKGWTAEKLGRYNEAQQYYDRAKQLGYKG